MTKDNSSRLFFNTKCASDNTLDFILSARKKEHKSLCVIFFSPPFFDVDGSQNKDGKKIPLRNETFDVASYLIWILFYPLLSSSSFFQRSRLVISRIDVWHNTGGGDKPTES